MSILKNYSYNLLYQITMVILPIITIPYVSRVIGSEGIGIYTYTNSIVQYFILFANWGLSLYASREIAFVQDDSYKKSKIFTEIVTIQFIGTLVVLFVYFLYILLICKNFKSLFLIQSISILAVAFDVSWFYIGTENFKKNVIRNLIVRFSAFFLLFILVKTPDDLWKYILLIICSSFLGQLYMWLGITDYIKKVQFKKLQLVQHVKKAKFFFLIISIGVISVNLNKTLIGLLVSTSELGKYEMSYRLIMVSLLFVTSLGSVMAPRISATFSEGDKIKVNEYIRMSLQFILFFCFLIIPVIILISNNFIHWFLGSNFKGAGLYFILLSPMILINSLSNLIATQYMIPSGNEKKYFISLIIGVLIGIISSFLLITKLSVVGACLSVLITECTILAAHIFQTRNQKELHNILGNGWQFIIACLPAFLFSYLLNHFIKGPILLMTFQISTSLIIYSLILMALKNNFLLVIYSKLKLIYSQIF